MCAEFKHDVGAESGAYDNGRYEYVRLIYTTGGSGLSLTPGSHCTMPSGALQCLLSVQLGKTRTYMF